MSDRLAAALAETSYDSYVRLPDGSKLPQSSAPDVVERVLHLLDVPEGGIVLEVGTGSVQHRAALTSRR